MFDSNQSGHAPDDLQSSRGFLNERIRPATDSLEAISGGATFEI